MSGAIGLLRVTISAVATALVIAACVPRPEPEGEPEPRPNGDDHSAPQEVPVATTEIRPGITLRLSIAAAPAAGEAIEFSLTVENGTADELVLDFPDGQRFDFEVLNGGTGVWRWAADMFFPQMLGRERIAPGTSHPWSASLSDGLPSGTHVVIGTLTTNPPHTLELEFDVAEGDAAR